VVISCLGHFMDGESTSNAHFTGGLVGHTASLMLQRRGKSLTPVTNQITIPQLSSLLTLQTWPDAINYSCELSTISVEHPPCTKCAQTGGGGGGGCVLF
jgi:hypothetical protein